MANHYTKWQPAKWQPEKSEKDLTKLVGKLISYNDNTSDGNFLGKCIGLIVGCDTSDFNHIRVVWISSRKPHFVKNYPERNYSTLRCYNRDIEYL